MVEINYSQVRIKIDTRTGRWAVATVGGSINSLNKQNTKQSSSGPLTEIAGSFFLRKKMENDLINETVTTVMFVGIKGGGMCRTAGFDKRLCGHFNVQYPGKELQSGAQRAKALTVSKSLLHSVNTSSLADSAFEDFHKLNTVVRIDLCTNASLFFHPPPLDNYGK